MDQKHAQSLDEPCLWMKLACNWFWHFVCLGTTVCLLCSPATGNVRNCVIPEQKPVCTNSPALSMLTKGSVGTPHTVNSDACCLQALLPPRVHYRFISQDVPKSSVFLFFFICGIYSMGIHLFFFRQIHCAQWHIQVETESWKHFTMLIVA